MTNGITELQGDVIIEQGKQMWLLVRLILIFLVMGFGSQMWSAFLKGRK